MHPSQLYIQQYNYLPDHELKLIEPLLKYRDIAALHKLLELGKVCRHLYFLGKGLFRFYIWRDGKVCHYSTLLLYRST